MSRTAATWIFVSLLLLTPLSTSFAVQHLPTEVPLPYRPSRQAMGFIGVAMPAPGYEFHNPASLGHAGAAVTFTAPIFADDSAVELIRFLRDNREFFLAEETPAYTEALRMHIEAGQFYNDWHNIVYQPLLSATYRGFGVALWQNSVTASRAEPPVIIPTLPFDPSSLELEDVLPKPYIRGYRERVLQAGYGRAFNSLPGFNAGVGVRFVNREWANKQAVNPYDMDSVSEYIGKQNDALGHTDNGFAVDIGLLQKFEFPGKVDPVRLQFGLTVNELLNNLDTVSDRPELNLGMMVELPYQFLFGHDWLRFGMDFEDMLNRREVEGSRRIKLGAELSLLSRHIFVRTGMNQAALTLGGGVRFWMFSLDGAWFRVSRWESDTLQDEWNFMGALTVRIPPFDSGRLLDF